jgi:hypothetical protein
MLSYNTSYHSTIATTPFELLFGEKPWMPSFPNPDVQRLHYGESMAAERYQLLQKYVSWPKTLAVIKVLKLKTILTNQHFPMISTLTTLSGLRILLL